MNQHCSAPRPIEDPARLDFSVFPRELIEAAFAPGNAARPEPSEMGVRFVAEEESRDPYIFWHIGRMYGAAGYAVSGDGGDPLPFSPGEKRAIVFRLRAEWGGAFELFYTAGGRTEIDPSRSITAVYGGDSEFFGERVSQYIIFEADDSMPDWHTCFGGVFRLDYTNFAGAGDVFLLEKAAFCADRAEAEAFIAADMEAPAPVSRVPAGYYVCLHEGRLSMPENNVLGVFGSLGEAAALCDRNRQYGYRVADENGTVIHTPYPQPVCDLMREAKYITVYAREQRFLYGDSCTNPGINHRPRRTSCDRLVDWTLYRAGFTDQPLIQGCVMSNLYEWCRKMGFEKISSVDKLRAGDIVFVRPDAEGRPQHTFLMASDAEADGMSLRYDHGSDIRIQSDQPTLESIEKEDAPFLYACRPTPRSSAP